jgi:SAM-dependent methyltransferase
MSTTLTTQAPAELTALKSRLKATWMDGNYDHFSRAMESSAAQFLDRLAVPAGATFLDVACGSGQLGILAARRGASVTGIDIATNSIAVARARAAAERLSATFDEGDAEALPYPDASFDVVATIYGAMFAPRPELVASEMLRVTRPGGMVAMANWTPEGFIGQMFRAIARFIAPPGMPSPVQWGVEEVVRRRFGAGLSRLELTRVHYRFDYPFGPAEVVEFFKRNYGPTTRAFAALDDEKAAGLRADLTELWTSHNRATDPNLTIVEAEYLEVIGIRAGGN